MGDIHDEDHGMAICDNLRGDCLNDWKYGDVVMVVGTLNLKQDRFMKDWAEGRLGCTCLPLISSNNDPLLPYRIGSSFHQVCALGATILLLKSSLVANEVCHYRCLRIRQNAWSESEENARVGSFSHEEFGNEV